MPHFTAINKLVFVAVLLTSFVNLLQGLFVGQFAEILLKAIVFNITLVVSNCICHSSSQEAAIFQLELIDNTELRRWLPQARRNKLQKHFRGKNLYAKFLPRCHHSVSGFWSTSDSVRAKLPAPIELHPSSCPILQAIIKILKVKQERYLGAPWFAAQYVEVLAVVCLMSRL